MKKEISFKCSPEQEEVIADHALSAGREEMKIQPDERAWILANARSLEPNCKVLAADLDIENGMWYVDIETTVTP
jgi:uncharacterized membrane protein YkoI